MERNPVNWFEIYVQDMARARAFYEAVFGYRLMELGPVGTETMLGFPGTQGAAGTPGSLVKAEGVASGGNSTVVYFGCEDCAVEAGRVAGAGGRILKDKFAIGQYGFVALAYDTEGNLFGMHSMR